MRARRARGAGRLAGVVSLSLAGCAEPHAGSVARPSPSAADGGEARVPEIAASVRPDSGAAIFDASRALATIEGDAGSFDAAAPLSLQTRALACLNDPTCSAAEADRLFRAADDAREDAVDCFRFADGDGTKADPRRARACLERAVASASCGGSSADLSQAELAVDLIDGVGGPVDIARARRIFDGCFDDVTKQTVLDHARAREADAGAPLVSFCKDYGGTTLTGNECSARARQHEETRGALAAKRVVAELDPDGRALFVTATRAYAAYADAMGSYVYEIYRDGTIRNAAALATESALLARRTTAVARLATYTPPPTTPVEAAASAKRLASAVKTAKAETAGVATELAHCQSAWSAYVDAEIALYVRALGARAAPDAVERAVRVRLEKERVADLQREGQTR